MGAVPSRADAPHREPPGLEELLQALSGPDAAALPEALLRDVLKQLHGLLADNARLGRQVTLFARQLERARAFAYHDELTGLPNRRLLQDHFRQARAHARRWHKRMALLFIDLDAFKHVNDRFGHLAGDGVLKEVASRLSASVRDDETACRFGGDEFVILLNDCDGEQSARRVIDRIRTRLSGAYVLQGRTIRLEASIGMAIYPDDGEECADLIRVADTSMLRQKRHRVMPSMTP